MTNYAAGHKAEAVAAEYLRQAGYKILVLNWRNKYCEIDIVAQKRRIIHFVEVKYRQTISQGSGLEYITANKLQQMGYAAESWVHDNNWNGEYVLSAMELSGPDYTVNQFLPVID
ncbi:MAG: YraN family protein [Candidatus Saccharimonadales bacterium]